MSKKIINLLGKMSAIINDLPFEEKVEMINLVREKIHDISPFKNEPVDFVRWVKNESVVANDYNPNKVAPPEMQLLEVSIINDGYTQPIVTFFQEEEEAIEIVDGFHRNRVGKESVVVRDRIKGYLPIVGIRKEKQNKNERIASTIRHNRARGKHQVSAMSEIVIELKNRNWSNKRIARELGMDEDEILRLCQVSGLENLFSDKDFNKAWVSNDSVIDEFEELNDDLNDEDMDLVRIPLENDAERIYHTFEKWESVEYNFFGSNHPKWSKTQCEHKYKSLLEDHEKFESTLEKVISEWHYSCQHNLTNKAMNRIAWLGQAALAYEYQIPSVYCSGYHLLDNEKQKQADLIALKYLNKWLKNNNMPELLLEEAISFNRQVELY